MPFGGVLLLTVALAGAIFQASELTTHLFIAVFKRKEKWSVSGGREGVGVLWMTF